MPFTKFTEKIEVQVYTCDNCGKRFKFGNNEKDGEIGSHLEKHSVQCTCNHQWTKWVTTNLGTWPDYEPYSTRECTICGKKEGR